MLKNTDEVELQKHFSPAAPDHQTMNKCTGSDCFVPRVELFSWENLGLKMLII